MNRVLIVDDIPAMHEQYAYDLRRLGEYETLTACSGSQALEIVEHESVDCMILDLEMPGMDGFEVLEALAKQGSDLPVIVYTATGNYDRCVRAVQLGAYGFIDKTESMQRVVREIESAIERRRLASEVTRLRGLLGQESQMIGESRVMQELRGTIERIAPISSTVLILGESGSGKELVARDLHRLSGRAKGPFLPINCAALPGHLVESELFGHEKGAFTGAFIARKGAFEEAKNGTLFLDEVAELTKNTQAKLLRVLEDHNVTPIGTSRQVSVDTRVVVATNRDLEGEITSGRFRQDLYYRLNVHIISVPPLRERLSDIPVLMEFFLETKCKEFGFRRKRISAGAIRLLRAYDWRRNNVRELRNAIERMVIACKGDEIQEEHVPAETRAGGGAGREKIPERVSADAWACSSTDQVRTLKERKAVAEREIILAALESNDWQITKTATVLGLADHSSLLKIMRRHKLRR